ncbi:MAG TPA: MFS transporter [Longimicrobiales bacterium]|nr:MFS transporter [Longimicrobiales bacterium]
MKVERREIVSWCLYDFSSSAFNTLIVTFIFNLFFVDVIAPDEGTGTALWTSGLSISAVVVALAMPVLGAIADYSGRKKTFLVIAALQSILFTTLLFFVGPGQAVLAITIFVLANIGFESANVFYYAFLPELTDNRNIGRVSGAGFFTGYMGGLLALGLGLMMVNGWAAAGNHLNIRATFLLVAAWFLVFSLPMFFLVRERAPRREASMGTYVREGFGRIRRTIGHLGTFREPAKLLLARMIYNDGLVTVIGMASIYARYVLDMDIGEVLAMGVALNVAAGIGAFAFGFVDDRIGGKKTIMITLVVLTIAGAIGVSADSRSGFWVAATLIGLMMGPNQSASRSLLARMVPDQKQTEFYGLFAFSGKLSALLGPLVYRQIHGATGDHKLAMSSIIAFFVIGFVMMFFVRERRGIEMAERLQAGAEVA